MKVYLSPAQHKNQGACSPGGVRYLEDYWARKVANQAAKALRAAGVTVKVSTNWATDNFVGAASQSNAWGADVHIPIHTNAGNGRMRGSDTFYASPKGKDLASTMLKHISKVSGTKRGVWYRSWHELTATRAVAAYLELDFHDNPAGCSNIVKNYKMFGKAVAEGILEHYRVKPQTGTSTKQRAFRAAFLALPKSMKDWVMKYINRWYETGK